ncbi:hypothetical protein [Nocardia thraciensis]
MASEDDADYDESGRPRDRGESEFGPPVSEFGPPLSEFGPPLTDFGPPTGESGSVGWSPVGEPDRPNLGWQPADAPATPAAPPVPPPPPQYRAPDSGSVPPPRGPAPTGQRGPDPYRGPETQRGPVQEVRGSSDSGRSAPPSPPSQPTGRYPEQADQGAARRPATPPRELSGSLWDDDELAKKLVAARPSPRESSSNSLWDDDDLAKKLAPSRPAAEPEPEKPRRNTGVLIGGLAAAFVVIVAIAAVIVFATRNNGGGTEETGAAPPSASAADSGLTCASSTEGGVVTGNGPGDTSTGLGTIFAFQHAYYTERNAARAHSFAVPDINLLPAPELQKAIDEQIPRGTTYCLRVATTGVDRFNVEITERRPDGSTAVYSQIITTVVQDGRTLISQIIF